MKTALNESIRVLKKDGHLIVVIGITRFVMLSLIHRNT
jgi:ubiquinone/menaquinone biosynthesis C-methylase UbiE